MEQDTAQAARAANGTGSSLPLRRVFVRDYETTAEIGVWHYEKGKRQRVRVNVDAFAEEPDAAIDDTLSNVVCYADLVAGIDAILAEGHIALVETLAERVAAMSLEDPRVKRVIVRVEKLDAIEGAASVGVEIERHQGR